jgi:hypothetical protein
VDLGKKMVAREIPVKIHADLGEPWDIEQILADHVDFWPEYSEELYSMRAL